MKVDISCDHIFLLIIIIIGITVYVMNCNNGGGGELREGFGPNVADADISAIRNLNGLANELMKPEGTLTNPGNLNVSGNISIPTGKMVTVRDAYHGIGYRSSESGVDGPSVYGWSGGALASVTGGAYKNALTWDNNSNIKAMGTITSNNEIIGTLAGGFGQFRATHGKYGTIFRQDGENFYVLTTNPDDPKGVWTDKTEGGYNNRPLRIENSTGKVFINNTNIQAVQICNTGRHPWHDWATPPFVVGTGTKIFNVNYSMWCTGGGTDIHFRFYRASDNVLVKDIYFGSYLNGGYHSGQSGTQVLSNADLPAGTYYMKGVATDGSSRIDGNDYLNASIITLPS